MMIRVVILTMKSTKMKSNRLIQMRWIARTRLIKEQRLTDKKRMLSSNTGKMMIRDAKSDDLCNQNYLIYTILMKE